MMIDREEVERLHSNAIVSIDCGLGLAQWYSSDVIAELCRVYLAVLDAQTGYRWNDPKDVDDWIVTPGVADSEGMPYQRVRILPEPTP